MAAKRKYYVVWQGSETGVFNTWDECKAHVMGTKGAMYKSFPSRAAAEAAFAAGPPADYYGHRGKAKTKLQNPPDYRNDTVIPLPLEVTADAVAVDAACSGNPGPMEYQGVSLKTGHRVFHFGPIWGTNNIGEFLAIVHALALLHKAGNAHTTIYSDSRNALSWVKKKHCATKLKATPKTARTLELAKRAEEWLKNHEYKNPVLKWKTSEWGETPADFGRK